MFFTKLVQLKKLSCVHMPHSLKHYMMYYHSNLSLPQALEPQEFNSEMTGGTSSVSEISKCGLRPFKEEVIMVLSVPSI